MEAPSSSSSSEIFKSYEKSLRWQNMTSTLWHMLILEARRVVDKATISSFLESMMWRMRGDLSEGEFSKAYKEWIGLQYPLRERKQVGLMVFRSILASRNIGEADCDLLLGLILHEENRRLLNDRSIDGFHSHSSFMGSTKRGGAIDESKGTTSRPYEPCTREWISACEDLFFLLDANGYGFLRFDDIHFIMVSLNIMGGSQTSEEELSVHHTTCQAWCFMELAGCSNMFPEPPTPDVKDISKSVTPKAATAKVASVKKARPVYCLPRSQVTLPMFKVAMRKVGITLSNLIAICSQIKALEGYIISTVQEETSCRDLFCAFHDASLTTAQTPKLWDFCASCLDDDSSPYVNFMKSDGQENVNIPFRCFDSSLEGTAPHLKLWQAQCESLLKGETTSFDLDVLDQCFTEGAVALCDAYATKSRGAGVATLPGFVELQEATFCLAQYKRLQHMLIDVARRVKGNIPQNASMSGLYKEAVATGLLPSGEKLNSVKRMINPEGISATEIVAAPLSDKSTEVKEEGSNKKSATGEGETVAAMSFTGDVMNLFESLFFEENVGVEKTQEILEELRASKKKSLAFLRRKRSEAAAHRSKKYSALSKAQQSVSSPTKSPIQPLDVPTNLPFSAETKPTVETPNEDSMPAAATPDTTYLVSRSPLLDLPPKASPGSATRTPQKARKSQIGHRASTLSGSGGKVDNIAMEGKDVKNRKQYRTSPLTGSTDLSGKDAGLYAHALRSMLRKMSLNGGEIDVQSLDRVIAIGKGMVSPDGQKND